MIMREDSKYCPWIQYDPEQWGPLADQACLVRLKGKTVIYNQEEDTAHIYIVKSGRVRLSYFDSEGAEKIYLFALRGCMFGEETCFDPGTQFLHAATIVDSELYCIPKDLFLRHLSRDVALNAQVLTSMSHKLHVLMEHIRRFSFLSARGRVAAVFVDLVHMFGTPTPQGIRIDLPVIQQGIGNLINVSRLTVNQIVGELELQGLLEKKDGRWMIYDLDGLDRLRQIR